MKKRLKVFLAVMLGMFLAALILLMSIRGEFIRYLDNKYTDMSFTVGFAKVDFIYEKFYAKATCLNDDTTFPICKSFKTKNIQEDYMQYKSQNQYNSRIVGVFYGSDIESQIKSITGGGKTPFANGGTYTQINVYLNDDAKHLSVVHQALCVLHENNIFAERIIFTYEKDKHVYEIWLSTNDYSLTEEEIKEKARKIK